MRHMLSGFVVVLACSALGADSRDAVFGRWASDNSILEIGESSGTLSARIVAILHPVYREGDDGPVGTVRVGLVGMPQGANAHSAVQYSPA